MTYTQLRCETIICCIAIIANVDIFPYCNGTKYACKTQHLQIKCLSFSRKHYQTTKPDSCTVYNSVGLGVLVNVFCVVFMQNKHCTTTLG